MRAFLIEEVSEKGLELFMADLFLLVLRQTRIDPCSVLDVKLLGFTRV